MIEPSPCNAYCDPDKGQHAILTAAKLPTGNWDGDATGVVVVAASGLGTVPCLPVGTLVRIVREEPASAEADPVAAGVDDEYIYLVVVWVQVVVDEWVQVVVDE